jgi:hypothetical protein
MKNYFKPMVLAAASASVLFSCKENENLNGPIPSSESLSSFFERHKEKPQQFTIKAESGARLETVKGVTLTIQPNSFVGQDGELVQGDVVVTVTEITEPSEMILNDMPTNALVNPKNPDMPLDSVFMPDSLLVGGMLNSFGEFNVEATQGAEELDLAPTVTIEVSVPQAALPEPIMGEFKPMWDYVERSTVIQNGYNHENQINFIDYTAVDRVQVGSEWRLKNDFCMPASNGNPSLPRENDSLKFSVGELGVYRNCDVLMQDSRPKTTLFCYFTNVFDTLNVYQNNALYFKQTGSNVMIKLTDIIQNCPIDKRGLHSYQNVFAIGMEGTLLAVSSAANGKLYAEQKAITIGQPAAGKNYFGVNFTLKEVSESQLMSMINAMNN